MKLKAVAVDQVLDDVAHPSIPGIVLTLPAAVEVVVPDHMVAHSLTLKTKIDAGDVEHIPIASDADAHGLTPFNPLSVTEGNFYWSARTINYDPSVVAHVHKFDMIPVATTTPGIFKLPGFDQYVYNTLKVYVFLADGTGIVFRRVASSPTAGQFVQVDTGQFATGPLPGGVILPLAPAIRCDYELVVLSGRLY